MLKQWIDRRLINPNKIYSVCINFCKNGRIEFHWILVKDNKGDYKILSSGSVSDATELVGLLDKKIPVSVIFEGKGILKKRVPPNDTETVLGKVLPGAKDDEFYDQSYPLPEDDIWGAVIRRSSVDEYLKMFSDQNFNVLNYKLGFFCLEMLSAYLPNCESFRILESDLIFTQGKLQYVTDESPSLQGITIEDEYVSPADCVLLAAAIETFTGFSVCSETRSPFLGSETYRLKKISAIITFSALIVIFVSLLINFVVFSEYDRQLTETNTALLLNSKIYDKLSVMQKEVEAKKNLADNISDITAFSFFSDRISSCMPQNISLLDMNICPVSLESKGAKSNYTYQKNVIQITGQTNSAKYINSWIRKLDAFSWIQDISIGKYEYLPKSNKGTFELTLKISADDLQ